MLTQEAMEQYYTDKAKVSFLLFDEIEKASDALWRLLLGILDKATLTLGDNRRVDFSRAMIFLTSNLGSAEMNRLITGGLGLYQSAIAAEELDQSIYRVAKEAARRKFSPEFMNRIDKVIVFRMLQQEHLEQILSIELGHIQDRILSSPSTTQFVFNCTPEARMYLLQEGADSKSGARELKRVIERYLVFPLSNLVATGQIDMGDCISVDYDTDGSRLTFAKEKRKMLVEA